MYEAYSILNSPTMYQLMLNRLRPIGKFVADGSAGANSSASLQAKLNPLMLQFRRVPDLCLIARTKRAALQVLVQQHADLLASLASPATAATSSGDAPAAKCEEVSAGARAPLRLPHRPRYLRQFSNVGGISGVRPIANMYCSYTNKPSRSGCAMGCTIVRRTSVERMASLCR